jgi:deazaflavin-dependent oxidoreductase (nitroreductase family)
MAHVVDSNVRIPGFLRFFDPIASRLLGAGVPMGPNALLTVRGRKTGLPRTTPIALVELAGRRWVQAPFGDVNWVRNLRASGEATLALGQRTESVAATELEPDEAAAFYADILAPYFSGIPAPVRWTLGSLLGLRDILRDPARAAREHPVFELRAKPEPAS